MEDVDLRQAKERLEELLARAARGEDVAIVDSSFGKIRLSPIPAPATRKPRRLGLLEGKMTVPEGLLDPMSKEELRNWYGEDP